ncbi:MAG: hypothetical protein EOP45_20865, partial [Sphingobacteriaceae bacterium]
MNHNTDDIKLFLFIGIAVMLLLFISFLLIFIFSQRKKFEYQKRIQLLRDTQSNQLIEAAVRSEETERHRIADALHDEVGAFLSSSKLYFQGITINKADEQNLQLYEKGKELLNEAIVKVRSISHNLHSAVLQQLGLNAAIRQFAEKIMLSNTLQVTTDLDDTCTISRPENSISIYRMVQELLSNIIRHAQASHIHISSVCKEHVHRISIVHNGAGLEQATFDELRFRKEGLGMKNIQNRIILLKGKIHFTKQGEQYRVDIE